MYKAERGKGGGRGRGTLSRGEGDIDCNGWMGKLCLHTKNQLLKKISNEKR